MTSLTYHKLELLICLYFPMAATRINKEGVSLDVASSPFKCHFGALMWPCGTLKKSSWTQKKNKKQKELIKHTEWSDVLVQCE